MAAEFYPLGRGEDVSEGEYQALCAEPDPELMGEEAYFAACEEWLARADLSPKSLDEPVGSWRTRDGRVLAVAEMSREHLANAVRLFERAGWGDHAKVDELRAELGAR